MAVVGGENAIAMAVRYGCGKILNYIMQNKEITYKTCSIKLL